MTPEQRSQKARMASHTRWAFEEDRIAATEKARAEFEDRFEREVDPEGRLSPAERARRARSLRSAHFARLAAKRHAKT